MPSISTGCSFSTARPFWAVPRSLMRVLAGLDRQRHQFDAAGFLGRQFLQPPADGPGGLVVVAGIVGADELQARRQQDRQFDLLAGAVPGLRDRQLIGGLAFQVTASSGLPWRCPTAGRAHPGRRSSARRLPSPRATSRLLTGAGPLAISGNSSLRLSPGFRSPTSYSSSPPAGCCKPGGMRSPARRPWPRRCRGWKP